MQTGFCLIMILIGIASLILGFRQGVKRGGRRVVPVDPEALLIRPTMAVERLIPLDGSHNFRDLGGYHTRNGQTVRWGKAFRSDELSQLSDADLAHLSQIGLRLAIDLRSPSEIKGQEALLPQGCAYRQMRVYKREPLAEYVPTILFRRHALSQALADSYILLAESRAEVFGAILRLLADAENFPLNYHCTSGKDRTGIVTALLLSLLGVPDETIIADYSLSNLGFEYYYQRFVARGQLDLLGVPYEEFSALFIVDPRWMENLLAYIRDRYGTVTDYLVHKAGLDLETQARIRINLLE